jgi:hypothetical protein|tara:strand:+ start:473 stop:892 length:420 start_codon:yes stop_codon:yes gene_type:complete
MKNFKEYQPTLECVECENTLHGDTPSIVITCDDCIQEKEMFENMNIAERLEEVVHWVTEDCWEELSKQSKARVIRQLGFMNYPVEDLKKEEAVEAYPDGWTCVECGDEYSERTTDVEDFYAINTSEGTLCKKCNQLTSI